jgi:hypothetical protein
MRSVIIAIVVSLVAAFGTSAQQTATPKTKAAGKKCTPEACIARGAKMGYSGSTAAIWCGPQQRMLGIS